MTRNRVGAPQEKKTGEIQEEKESNQQQTAFTWRNFLLNNS
jgi:hypothetical protein